MISAAKAFGLMLLLLTPLTVAGCGSSNEPGQPDLEPHAAILVIHDDWGIVRHDASGRDTLTILAELHEAYHNLRPQPGTKIVAFSRLSPGGSSPGEPYRMTTQGADVAPYPGPGANGGSIPLWSPDGSRAGWSVPLDAGTGIILTPPDLSAPDTVAFAESFGWGADAQHLVITYRPANLDQEIGAIDLAGTRQRTNLTNSAGDDAYPAWSPLGSSIAFYSNRTAGVGVYLMDSDGSHQRYLLNAIIRQPPMWAPDGQRLAIIDEANPAASVLRIVAIDGTELTLPDSLASRAYSFSWSPSGKHALLFRRGANGPPIGFVTSASVQRATRLTSPTFVDDGTWITDP